MPDAMSEAIIGALQRAKERVAGGWRGPGRSGSVDGADGQWCVGLACFVGEEIAVGVATQWMLIRALGLKGPLSLFRWNDAHGRTLADVLDALDAAIRLAKEEAPHA